MSETALNVFNREIGRPTVITEDVLRKLEIAFSLGATDKVACTIANIAPTTLYEYQIKNPDFAERKQELKDMVTWQAKANVVAKITEGDIPQSNWWLERKAKDEFGTRTENVNLNIDAKDLLTEEEQTRIESLLHGGTSESNT